MDLKIELNPAGGGAARWNYVCIPGRCRCVRLLFVSISMVNGVLFIEKKMRYDVRLRALVWFLFQSNLREKLLFQRVWQD